MLVKWQGPVFTKMETLSENPVWESTMGEYVDYVQATQAADPDCRECNASACPRLYLNGWPAFKELPWLREYVVNPTFFDDSTATFIAENDELRELFLEGLSQTYQSPPVAERQKAVDDEYWELTKIFISPKGALTRLHFDNGGAHGWLSQVRGRKLFICYKPSDTENLHAFSGDEGLCNGSWLDPLDDDVCEKWPNYIKATPYVATVEEGETIVIPQGWWHYAIALDNSITVMRNFYSQHNKTELISRKDGPLGDAIGIHVLKLQPALKNQPDKLLKEIARKTVTKIRQQMEAAKGPHPKRLVVGARPPGGWPGAPHGGLSAK